MTVRIATEPDTEAWADLRARLWPTTPMAAHREEIRTMLARPRADCIAFLDEQTGVGVRAFAEAALRRDHVNGCDTTPVAFLEGIFVHPDHRGRGLGRDLLHAVRSWAQDSGCTELGSDANLANAAGQAFHSAVGFEETERVIFFRMRI